MARQVNWNRHLYDRFCELAMLSDFEKKVLEYRIKGYSILEQAALCGCSDSTINRVVARLKEKYDHVQKLPGSDLPIRKDSEQERWMDTH